MHTHGDLSMYFLLEIIIKVMRGTVRKWVWEKTIKGTMSHHKSAFVMSLSFPGAYYWVYKRNSMNSKMEGKKKIWYQRESPPKKCEPQLKRNLVCSFACFFGP